MASTSTSPPPPVPQAPPPYRYRRSIAGPLVLIVIGMVFLLRNMGVHLPMHWFGHWWPLLLILWGVIRMVEHSMAQRGGYARVGLGGGSILLLVLIVIAGLSVHYSSDVDWGGVRDQIQMDDDLGNILGSTSYTFDETLQQSFPAKGDLRVVCDRGDLNISPSDDNTLRVVVHKRLHAKSQEEANKYNEGTHPQITVNGSTVVLNANTNGAGEHGVQSDMEVFVPRDASLDVSSKVGDVTINDRKADVKVTLQKGDVQLEEITGAAKINVEKGTVRASKIGGDLDVSGRVESVSAEECGGAVHLSGEFFRDIHLSQIAKTVTFNSARSDMEIASVSGDIDIATDSVRGNGIHGPARVVTSSKSINLEDVFGELQVETTNGEVEIRAADKLPMGRMTITGKHGRITLVVPPNAGFQLQATTRKGTISSDFNAIKVSETGGGTTQASGTVGNGVAKVQITADTGDIQISKG